MHEPFRSHRCVQPPLASQESAKRRLSIVVPFYNEQENLERIVLRSLSVPLPEGWERELILVDDGSTDASGRIAEDLAKRFPDVVRVLHLEENLGKGGAVRAGYRKAGGDVVLVQDADLEYDPRDYARILREMDRTGADAVYGSRVRGRQGTRYRRYWYGGRLVTTLNNLFYATTLTDQPTCYKCVRKAVLDRLRLSSRGFEFCTELTCELLAHGYRIAEVPIRYYPRSFEEGKKIRPWHGVKAVWWMVRVRWRHWWGLCGGGGRSRSPHGKPGGGC